MANDPYVGFTRSGARRFSNPTTVGSFITGNHNVLTTGTTMSSADLDSGVRIKAFGGTIFVGGSDVTTNTGYKLEDESEVFIDVNSMNKVFVRAASTGFTASFIAS
jgi:hypothetical protein